MANESLLEPAPLVEQKQSRRYADWLRQNKDLMDTDEYATIARAYQMARRKEESLTGMEAIQEGIANLPASTLKLGKDVVTGAADALSFPFREPRKFAETAFSVAQTALPAVSGQPSESPLTAPAAGILGHYRGYLEPDVLKRRFADDPASTLSDLSLVGYAGGRLLKAVPTAPTEYVGGKIAGFSEAVDPLTVAAKTVAYPIKEAGKIPYGAPSQKELTLGADIDYARATAAGVAYTPESTTSFIENLQTNLLDEEGKKVSIIKDLNPATFAVIEELQKYKGKPQTMDDLENLRRVANGAIRVAAKSGNDLDLSTAMLVRGKIDEFVLNPPSGAVIMGRQKEGAEALFKARDQWARKSKSDEIENLIEISKLEAEGQQSLLGYENAIRKNFKLLAKNKNRMRRFSKEEQAAIKDVVKGGPTGNVLRAFGLAAPTGIVSAGLSSAIGAGGGALASGLGGVAFGGIGLPLVGGAAKLGSTAITSAAAKRASAIARAGDKPVTPQQRLARLLEDFGDVLEASASPDMRFAIDMARRAKGNVNPYLTRQLIAQLENMEKISQQRQALEQEEQ